jgi:DNA (cytosine-5)-methyltransferase 1
VADQENYDLFCGAGGWGVGARLAGVADPIGIDNDRDAARSHELAGFPTRWADVASFPIPERGSLRGLIASPPCQPFSKAGLGAGRPILDDVAEFVRSCRDGWHEPADEWRSDDRVGLVVEPLRWALAALPEWCAWEQVPEVLPVWQAAADVLACHGYHAWAGVLSAERYGVAQTRKRAVLIASRAHAVRRPPPTHQAYRKGEPPWDGPRDGLLPWVSMAAARGWGMTDRPYPTIASARTTGGPDKEWVGGTNGRRIIYDELDAGRWIEQPPLALRGSNDRPNATIRSEDEPAPTVAFGHAAPEWVLNTGCDWQPGGDRDDAQQLSLDVPAPTVTSMSVRQWQIRPVAGEERLAEVVDDAEWCAERPATTIAGRLLVPHPGANANRFNDSTKSRNDGVRISLRDALVLQSFPADYPLFGNATSCCRQIGNAIPPLLAAAVLREAAGVENVSR